MKTLALIILLTLVFTYGNSIAQGDDQQQASPYELASIQFHGNNAFSSSVLAGLISSQETPGWVYKTLHKISSSMGRETQYFDSLKIPEDKKAIESFYRDNGYFTVRITSTFEINEGKKEATLIYNITEGKQFSIRHFVYRGLDSLPPGQVTEDVRKMIVLDSTKNFTKQLVDENVKPLITYLRDHGFMLADNGRPNVFVYPDSGYVDVRIPVTLGARYHISQLRVEKKGEGKDFVEDDLITKIAAIKAGDYYSNDEKQRAQVRLYRTNLFSSVLISAIIEDTSDNFVPLNISGDIGPLHDLAPEVIVNNQANAFNLGLGAAYTKRNFFGEARTFTLGASFGIQDVFNTNYANLFRFLTAPNDTTIRGYLDIRAAVEQPYIFNKRITSRLESYFTVDKQKEYRSTTYGAKLSFDFELPKFVYFNSLIAYYTVERSVYDLVPDYVRRTLLAANFSADSIKNLNFDLTSRDITSIIGTDIGAAKTNNLMFPTKGYNLSLTIEEANLLPAMLKRLGANFNVRSQFYRLLGTATYFPNLYNSVNDAFGMKLRFGYLQTYAGTKDDVPINKRFAAGGSNSVRGWRARQLIPAQSYRNVTLTANDFQNAYIKNFSIGGTFLVEGSFETRNRIIGSLGGAVFVDYGNSFEGYNRFRFKDVAVATGLGLRYYTSFAPFRIDFGFKAYDPSDGKTFFQKFQHSPFLKNIEIHLGLGEAF